MITRAIGNSIRNKLFKGKAILVFGARQVGKTTMLKNITEEYADDRLMIDGENTDVQSVFEKATEVNLKNYFGKHKLIIIDEAQKIKNIGSALKLCVDYLKDVQVIASGSSSFELQNKLNEPLTGRKWEYNLYPISFNELKQNTNLIEEKRNLYHRLVYGCYPEIVTNTNDIESRLQILANSYLYKDILTLDSMKKPDKIIKVLKHLAYYIGTEISINKISSEVGISSNTCEKYIDILEKAYIIFQLPSYCNNHAVELKKSKKIYFYDNGIRNALINDFRNIESRNEKEKGPLFENYIISELYKEYAYTEKSFNFYFWRSRMQQEIDLIIEYNNTLITHEIKWSASAKARLPKTFNDLYPDNIFSVINNENYFEVLGEINKKEIAEKDNNKLSDYEKKIEIFKKKLKIEKTNKDIIYKNDATIIDILSNSIKPLCEIWEEKLKKLDIFFNDKQFDIIINFKSKKNLRYENTELKTIFEQVLSKIITEKNIEEVWISVVYFILRDNKVKKSKIFDEVYGTEIGIIFHNNAYEVLLNQDDSSRLISKLYNTYLEKNEIEFITNTASNYILSDLEKDLE